MEYSGNRTRSAHDATPRPRAERCQAIRFSGNSVRFSGASVRDSPVRLFPTWTVTGQNSSPGPSRHSAQISGCGEVRDENTLKPDLINLFMFKCFCCDQTCPVRKSGARIQCNLPWRLLPRIAVPRNVAWHFRKDSDPPCGQSVAGHRHTQNLRRSLRGTGVFLFVQFSRVRAPPAGKVAGRTRSAVGKSEHSVLLREWRYCYLPRVPGTECNCSDLTASRVWRPMTSIKTQTR